MSIVESDIITQELKPSEAEQMWNKSIENVLLKGAIGAVGGLLASPILGRTPATRGIVFGLSTGIGIGIAYHENQLEFERNKL